MVTVKGDADQTYTAFYATNCFKVSRKRTPAITYISLEPGKSVSFANNGYGTASLGNSTYSDDAKQYYDYAVYKDGASVNGGRFTSDKSATTVATLAWNEECVVTARKENTKPLILKYATEAAAHELVDDPALTYYSLEAGESCIISPVQNRDYIRVSSNADKTTLYDYVTYSDEKPENVEFGKNQTEVLRVAYREHSVLTAAETNQSTLVLYTPERTASIFKSELPALSCISVPKGGSIKFFRDKQKIGGLSVKSTKPIKGGVLRYDEDEKELQGSTGTSYSVNITLGGSVIINLSDDNEFYYPYGMIGVGTVPDLSKLLPIFKIYGHDMYENDEQQFILKIISNTGNIPYK